MNETHLAQIATEKQELIALRHGYSGRSMLAQSLTAHAKYRAVPTQIGQGDAIVLNLNDPDFTTATRLVVRLISRVSTNRQLLQSRLSNARTRLPNGSEVRGLASLEASDCTAALFTATSL